MRKIFIAIAVAGAAAAAAGAYWFAGGSAEAEEVTLYKDPQCGCCQEYAEYLNANGFDVTVKATYDVVEMSRKAGVPDAYQGCHLAVFDDYVVSGHVPLSTIRRLLAERPAVKGLTLPGMPQGSPGMSGPKTEPFTIYAVGGPKLVVYAVE